MNIFKIQRFCLNSLKSPTYYNISQHLKYKNWVSTRFRLFSHFSEKHFEFDKAACECLEFKHELARLVSSYCPDIMPMTYNINETNKFEILNNIIKNIENNSNISSVSPVSAASSSIFATDPTFSISSISSISSVPWILKPALQNNGQNIKIFNNINEVVQYYQTNNRLGGEHVLQHYLKNPHLLQGPEKGHKYSLRVFVILTNYRGAYLYPTGYFNIALQPYEENDFTDTRCHLTNEHLYGDAPNVVQIPSFQYDIIYKNLYPKIKNNITLVLNGLKNRYPKAFECHKNRRLAIFGFDFMADVHQRVWLLEANHGPCFPVDNTHALQEKLYFPFWDSLVSCFVEPMAKKIKAPDLEHTRCYPFERVL